MSAEDQGSPATPSTPTEAGPVEIVFETVSAPKEVAAPKADVTDVVPKAETTTTENDEGSDSADAADSRDGKGRFKPGVQTRIDELTRSRREAEREAAYWKARAQGTDSAQSPAQSAAKPKPPVQSDFATLEEFQDAMVDFRVEQKVTEKFTAKENEKNATDAVIERANSWQSRLDSARAAISDFNEVMDTAEIPVAPHVADLLFEHDLGANLAYHFAKNPDVLTKLNTMSPAKAAFELGKIGDKLEAAAPAANADKPTLKVVDKPISKAPPPAQTIGQGRATTPSLEDTSMDDYVARRKAQGAGWAR